jgi:RNA polymerase sigma-70 factor (ECF subfamily)
LQKGEEKGLDFFFNRYYSAMVYYSLSITHDEDGAEDAVLEAFIKLWNVKETITECKKIKFLLYRIVRNTSINFLRTEKSRRQRSENLYAYQDKYEDSPLEKMVETETYHKLYLLVSQLPPRCSQIFRMFYFQDKPIKEIARELNISVNTVKTQKQRAIQMLRDQQSLLQIFLVMVMFSMYW